MILEYKRMKNKMRNYLDVIKRKNS